MKKDIYYTSFFIFFFSFASIFSQTTNQTYFPSIIELSSKDPVFKQYCQDVELNYKKIAKKTLGLVEPGDKVYINSNDK